MACVTVHHPSAPRCSGGHMVAVAQLVSGDLVEVFVPTIADVVVIYDGSSLLPQPDPSWPKRSYAVIGIDTRVPPERALLWVTDPDVENVVRVRSTATSRAFLAQDHVGGRLISQSNIVGLDVTWVAEHALNISFNPVLTPSESCSNCKEPNTYGSINQPDGSFVCYACRQDPWSRRRA